MAKKSALKEAPLMMSWVYKWNDMVVNETEYNQLVANHEQWAKNLEKQQEIETDSKPARAKKK